MELTEKSKLEEKSSVESKETECSKCQGRRKRFIGYIVMTVLLAIFVLTAVTAGTVIYAKSMEQYVERSLAGSDDKEPKIIVFQGVDEDGRVNSFVSDRRSQIETVRLSVNGSSFVCFAYPHNEKGTEEFESYDPKSFNMTNVNSGLCTVGKIPVPEAGSLNKEVKKLCRGWPLYWTEKSCLIVKAKDEE